MSEFKKIDGQDDIKEVIKVAFGADLEISGAWGYEKESAILILESNQQPLLELEYMLASMRAHIEMSMTLESDKRYGAINLNECSREKIEEFGDVYDKVCYEIQAMKETDYTNFINEYKENHEKEDFDMSGHFNRRKEATLKREMIYWFKVE